MRETESKARPPVLFVAPIMPSDRGNGLAMRAGFFLDSYAKRFEIDLAVVPLAGGPTEVTPFVTARTRRTVVLRTVAPDTHFALIAGIADAEARLMAFRQYARPSITSALSAEIEGALQAFAGRARYELIHTSRLYLAKLAKAWMRGKQGCVLILDCDEDDARAYRRLAWLYRKWGMRERSEWAEAEAEAFARLATQCLPRFDLLLAASATEAHALRTRAGNVHISVIPNVVPSDAVAPVLRSVPARDVLFVGNMGYFPNVDAAMWFGLRVWPTLRRIVPRPIRFVIAGSGAPRQVMDLMKHAEIVLTGGIDDLRPMYRRAALAVVPIRAGGGTRIKLLEAAGHGVPVVATRFGAVGSGFRSGHELLLADGAREFATSCARLLNKKRLALGLAARARRMARREYVAERWGTYLLDLVDRMTEGRNDGGSSQGRRLGRQRGP